MTECGRALTGSRQALRDFNPEGLFIRYGIKYSAAKLLMLKHLKIAAFLVVVAVLFPLFHHETVCVGQNGRKSAIKSVLLTRGNAGSSSIKLTKKSTRAGDADFRLEELPGAFSDYDSHIISTESIQFVPPACKYAIRSKATFS